MILTFATQQNKLKRLLKRSLQGHSELAKISPILEQYSFFKSIKQKLTTDKYVELINEISVVEIPKYQTVFHYGDMGRKFYIILQGSVFVVTPDNSALRQKNDQSEQSISIDYTFLNNLEDKDLYDDMMHKNNNMKIVAVLKQDNTFGEVALRSNVPRTASVICRETSTLISINVDAYHSIVEEYHSALYEEDISFLQRFPFLQGWTKAHTTNLLRYIRKVQCFRNQVIYNIGDPTSKIYLIKHGEFQMLQPDRNSIKQDFTEDIIDEVDELNLTKKRNKNNHLCEAAILSDYCSFGTEEIASTQTTRNNKVVCVSSEALLYEIDKNSYFNVMQDRNLFKDLRVENKIKSDWREKQGEERKILKELYTPKSSIISLSNLKFNDNLDSFKLNDISEYTQSMSNINNPPKQRLSLQLNNKKTYQQQHLFNDKQTYSQSYLNFQSNENDNHNNNNTNNNNQIDKMQSIRKIPLWQSNQQLSNHKLPLVGSFVETNQNQIQDIYQQNQMSNNLGQNNQYKSKSQLVIPPKQQVKPSNMQQSRSLTAYQRVRAFQMDAEENERPLLDCYVNAMLKKTLHSKQSRTKVYTQKEFFAAIRQTQQKKRYCTPNEEGKKYIKVSQQQKENIMGLKSQTNNPIKKMSDNILGDLMQDSIVKQDLHNIRQTFLHEQRMSLKNTHLHRKLTNVYQL